MFKWYLKTVYQRINPYNTVKETEYVASLLNSGNRWYDEFPQMVKAVDLMESLPEQYRLCVANAVLVHTEEHSLLGTSEELKSLGHHRVLGLIQSKLRRRWYDKNPTLHKAINNVLLMNDDHRQNMFYRLIISLEALEAYRESCESQGVLLSFDEMTQIVNEIFSKSFDDLVALTTGQVETEETSKEDPSSKSVVDDDSGMKVSQFFQLD